MNFRMIVRSTIVNASTSSVPLLLVYFALFEFLRFFVSLPLRALALTAAGAGFALTVLTAINLLNYIDRFIPSATKELIKAEMHLTDTQTALPFTAFIIVYMLASPFFGAMADKGINRTWILCAAIFVWSLSTAAAFSSRTLYGFLITRCFVGVGEAAYACIAPALISDFYPPAMRNWALTIYQVAIPVGAALGFSLGSVLAHNYSWRHAFLMCGMPGLIAALCVLYLNDPGPNYHTTHDELFVHEGEHEQHLPKQPEAPSTFAVAKSLYHNATYRFILVGWILVTFSTGALADWLPALMRREFNAELKETGLLIGAVTVVGGLVGTSFGGYLAERLHGITRQPYMCVAALSLFPASLFAFSALAAKT